MIPSLRCGTTSSYANLSDQTPKSTEDHQCTGFHRQSICPTSSPLLLHRSLAIPWTRNKQKLSTASHQSNVSLETFLRNARPATSSAQLYQEHQATRMYLFLKHQAQRHQRHRRLSRIAATQTAAPRMGSNNSHKHQRILKGLFAHIGAYHTPLLSDDTATISILRSRLYGCHYLRSRTPMCALPMLKIAPCPRGCHLKP